MSCKRLHYNGGNSQLTHWKNKVWAVEVSQLVKRLPQRREDWGVISRIHVKGVTMAGGAYL